MAKPEIFHETIALAALFQTAEQIREVARNGVVNEKAIAPLMRALIITDPEEVTDVYRIEDIRPGLRSLSENFGPAVMTEGNNKEMVKMALNIISLSGSIMKQKTVYSRLDNNVDRLRADVLLIHPDYETAGIRTVLDYDVIRLYSKIYSELISPNFPKLIIYGEEQYLRRSEFQEMIRALLLAGIRASVLWTQLGGGKYSMMLKYKEITECASDLLKRS